MYSIDAFVGEIQSFGFSFVPSGFLACDGSKLKIKDYEVLFAVIGNTYGGDGITDFALPDLRCRSIVGVGTRAVDNMKFALGQTGGQDQIMISADQIAPHTHTISATNPLQWPVNSSGPATNSYPDRQYLAPTNFNIYLDSDSAPTANYGSLNGKVSPNLGLGYMSEIINPYQTFNWCICANGIFPQRPSSASQI